MGLHQKLFRISNLAKPGSSTRNLAERLDQIDALIKEVRSEMPVDKKPSRRGGRNRMEPGRREGSKEEKED